VIGAAERGSQVVTDRPYVLRCVVCGGRINADGQRPITIEDDIYLIKYRGQGGYSHGRCSVERDGGVMEHTR
jgi:hypothetical protein